MNQYASEAAFAVILVALAGALWNPYWMPMGALYVVLVCFVAAVGAFAAFVWRARGGDERDALIRQIASRIGFLAATAVLTVGIIWQALSSHAVDSWLVIAFMAAILGKTIGYAYGKSRH